LIVGIEELIKGFLASGVDVGTLGLTTDFSVFMIILFGDIVIINKWKTN
jgi:hypothetical protein